MHSHMNVKRPHNANVSDQVYSPTIRLNPLIQDHAAILLESALYYCLHSNHLSNIFAPYSRGPYFLQKFKSHL
jgi:hypothetical protein